MEERGFGIHPMIVGHPLENWDVLKTYKLPSGPDMSLENIESQKEQVGEVKKNGGIVIQHFLRLFERLQ